MVLEARLELRVPYLVDQLRQCLVGERTLDVEDVSELVQEQVARGGDFTHRDSFLDSQPSTRAGFERNSPEDAPRFNSCLNG